MASTARDDGDGPRPSPPRRPRHRLRRALLIVAAVVVTLAAAAVALFVWGANPPEQATVEEARERFSPGSSTPSTQVVDRAPPPQGIYRFVGSGTEDTSFPPVEELQGPEMPVTITWTDPGCFTQRIDYNTNHWQEWHLCLTDDALTEHGGSTFQRRDYTVIQVDSRSTFVCDPPAVVLRWDAAAGDRTEASCVGTTDVLDGSTTSAGTNTLVGQEDVRVGDEVVPAHHVRGERTLRGDQQSGEESWDTWFAVDTGMIVRSRRAVSVRTDTPFATVDYDETSEWTLQDLRPVG